ncbi:MAG: hypothetical protein QXI33_03095 [Candidatus Pacearchaeota archaeon]
MVIGRKTFLLINLFFVFIFIQSMGYAGAQNYIYGDIYINSYGEVDFNIDMNVEDIFNKTSQEFTTKIGSNWEFKLDKSIELGNFSQIILNICLPENLDYIEKINTDILYRIDISNKVCIGFIDSNKPLNISIKYKLNSLSDFFSNYLFFIILIFVMVFFIIFLLFFFVRKKRNKFSDIKYLVNENEMKILDLLTKGDMRQKEIRKKLGFPKASFSRYLYNLEKKHLIKRRGEGKNKIVMLK